MTTSTPQTLESITSHQQYVTSGIDPASLSSSPLEQFDKWFKSAIDHPTVVEPEAVALSTVSQKGVPSTRIVLLKQVDERGFVIFTNYESRKGKELFPNGLDQQGGYASMAFYWHDQHRSVRVVGRAEKLEEEKTKEYFDGRPVGSRIGAWASHQSSVLEGREELEAKVAELEAQYGVKATSSSSSGVDAGPTSASSTTDTKVEAKDAEIPVPPFWGGVRIVPFEVEFWMGRESRLHDRFRYTREEGSDEKVAWKVDRLSP